jgi:hypothetical protein
MTMQSVIKLLRGAIPPSLYRVETRLTAERIAALAEQNGWQFYRLDGAVGASKAAFIDAAARQLGFPAYSGRNWDAFEESLNDLSWLPEGRQLLLFDDAKQFASSEPAEFAVALEILAAAVARRQASARPLAVLVRGAGRLAAEVAWL